ncbi:protein of unknown function [Caballeronia sp. S22]
MTGKGLIASRGKARGTSFDFFEMQDEGFRAFLHVLRFSLAAHKKPIHRRRCSPSFH